MAQAIGAASAESDKPGARAVWLNWGLGSLAETYLARTASDSESEGRLAAKCEDGLTDEDIR